eukprot:4089457-Amphidinium_carterae.2
MPPDVPIETYSIPPQCMMEELFALRAQHDAFRTSVAALEASILQEQQHVTVYSLPAMLCLHAIVFKLSTVALC